METSDSAARPPAGALSVWERWPAVALTATLQSHRPLAAGRGLQPERPPSRKPAPGKQLPLLTGARRLESAQREGRAASQPPGSRERPRPPDLQGQQQAAPARPPHRTGGAASRSAPWAVTADASRRVRGQWCRSCARGEITAERGSRSGPHEGHASGHQLVCQLRQGPGRPLEHAC